MRAGVGLQRSGEINVDDSTWPSANKARVSSIKTLNRTWLGSYQTRDYKSHSGSRHPPADRRSGLSPAEPDPGLRRDYAPGIWQLGPIPFAFCKQGTSQTISLWNVPALLNKSRNIRTPSPWYPAYESLQAASPPSKLPSSLRPTLSSLSAGHARTRATHGRR